MRSRILLLLAAGALWGQLDERRVSSPDGEIEFRIFIAPPPDAASLDGIAYQVWYRGKVLLETSYLGFEIYSQTPLLGEKVGLTSSRASSGPGFHGLTAEYLQNGSLGRRINVEVRVFDSGIAFRYEIPRSPPLEDLYIAGEVTDFRFAHQLAPETSLSLPFVAELPGVGWVSISETPPGGFPAMTLAGMGGGRIQAILKKSDKEPWLAFSGHTPVTTPWRIVAIGGSREAVIQPGIARKLP